MKIKTITCHDVYNHGASLQTFALQQHLEDLGHQVEIIDYKPEYLSNHFSFTVVSNPKFDKPVIKYLYLLAKLPLRLCALPRKKTFDKFKEKYLKITSIRYTNNEELKNNLPIADAYICGSDQIWNSFFKNGNDPAFYLDFVPDDKRKISYAPSFATESIDENFEPFVKEKIKRLNAISVRETSGLNILRKMGIDNAVQVMDPVFLLPANYWKRNFAEPVNENYVFVYDFDSNPLIERIVKKMAAKYNYKIISVNKNIKYADKNYWKKGPGFFISLIYNAKFVISNSFHATAFSLIFEKPFCVISRTEAINTRMKDLLMLFDMQNRIINNETDSEHLQNIDYSKINLRIEKESEKSKLFLTNALY